MLIHEINRNGKVAFCADEETRMPLYAMYVLIIMMVAICQILF